MQRDNPQNEPSAASALNGHWHRSPLAWFQVTKCAVHCAATVLACLEAITSFISIVVVAFVWHAAVRTACWHFESVIVFTGWNQAPGGFQTASVSSHRLATWSSSSWTAVYLAVLLQAVWHTSLANLKSAATIARLEVVGSVSMCGQHVWWCLLRWRWRQWCSLYGAIWKQEMPCLGSQNAWRFVVSTFPHALYVYSVCLCSNCLDHCLWFASLPNMLLILLLPIEQFAFFTASLTCPGSALITFVGRATSVCMHTANNQLTHCLDPYLSSCKS